MADVRQMLGDAPQEQVTTGTAGRVSEETDIFGTIAKGASGFMSMMQEREKNSAARDKAAAAAMAQTVESEAAGAVLGVLNDSANFEPSGLSGNPTEDDAELAAVQSDVAALDSKAVRQGESGRMSPQMIARRKLVEANRLAQKYPGYQDVILKMMGGGSLKGLEEQMQEQATYDLGQQRAAVEAQRKAVITAASAYGVDPSASFEQQQAVVSALAPSALRVKQADLAIAALQADGKYSKAKEEEFLINNARDVNLSAVGTMQRAWASTTDPVARRDALMTAAAQVRMSLVSKFPNMGGSEETIKKYLPGFAAYSENIIRMSDERMPKEQLARLEASNNLLLEQSKFDVLSKNPQLVDTVAVAQITDPLMRNFDDITKQQYAQNAAPLLTKVYGAVKNNYAIPGPTDDLPEASLRDRSQVAGTMRTAMRNLSAWASGIGKEDKPNAELFGQTLVGAFNDRSYQYTQQATVSMLPTLADPRTAELIKQGGLDLTEIGGKRLNQAMAAMTEQVQRDLGGKLQDKLKFDVNKETGYITVTPQILPRKEGDGKWEGVDYHKVMPKTAKDFEVRLNQTVKARAHLQGGTDYKTAALQMFGGVK